MLVNLGPDQARTAEDTTPLIEIDEASFGPRRAQPVRHRRSEHPLLQTASLASPGERLEAQDSIRTHGSARRKSLLHAAHSMMRGVGITPSPVEQKPLLGAMKHAGIATMLGCRRIGAALTGSREQSRRARFTLVES